MSLDNKISFLSGAAVSTASVASQAITFDSTLSVAILGFVGGFCGLAGKQLFYYLKNKWS